MGKIKVKGLNEVDIRKQPFNYVLKVDEIDLKSILYSLELNLVTILYLEELLEFCIEEEYYEIACIVRDELNSRDIIETLFN